MTKMPTNRAIPANTPKKIVRNDNCCLMSDCVSSVISAPVTTSTPWSPSASRAPWIESASSRCDTPSWAVAEIVENRPSSPISCWASGTVHITKDAPPGLSAVPNRTIPTSSKSSTPSRVWTGTVSPTW